MSSTNRYWIFVLSNIAAIEWVAGSKTMAFRDHIHVDQLTVGDKFALYATRGAGGNPTRDRAQFLGIGTIRSGNNRHHTTSLGDEEFRQSVAISFDEKPLDYRRGAIVTAEIVEQLSFMPKKEAWFAYVRKSLVSIPAEDFALIANAVTKARMEELSKSD
jgi:hypothetical protein